LEDPTCNPGTSRIEVNLLKYPYREFAWLFSRILGLESTMFVTRNVIYAMHYALHEKAIIDWGYLISSEISFQLNNLKKTHKFYMASYLIFSIAYGHVFEDFPREKHVDFKLEPVYAWYSILYRHKSQYSFYPVHNNFISEFKRLIFRQSTSRLSLEATSFLTGKGIYELSEEFTVIRIFGSKEKPFLLPFYTSDKLFVGEVCRQYKTWALFLP
jgi:hypothetical protein